MSGNEKTGYASKNQLTYDSKDIVDFYIKYDVLQAPERAILDILKRELNEINMLDIGVGGGRTTKYFAPLCKKYIGIDYAPNMIEACRKKYPRIRFEVADARDLSIFDDNTFNLTLFSNNGLDYIDSKDRVKVLKEIRRITKEDGYLCISTHNLNHILQSFKFKFPTITSWRIAAIRSKPYELYLEFNRVYRFRSKNKIMLKKAKDEPFLLFNDGEHNSRLMTHYIKPKEQVKQLKNIGFKNVQVFSPDGRELNFKNLATTNYFYLYFLAK